MSGNSPGRAHSWWHRITTTVQTASPTTPQREAGKVQSAVKPDADIRESPAGRLRIPAL